MNRKSHPFSSLTAAQLDAILDRARDERARAIASFFARLRRWIGSAFKRPFSPAHTAHTRTRALLPH